ncbi:hypothetical protein H5T51_00970 [Candidatus Bathyarchaeota archaeon]|nr:hypothetical protein [Candidatus Bathyarchaeota archaeon]
MDKFEEALRNIDIFCKVFVKKMFEEENSENKFAVDPMEKLLKKKITIEKKTCNNKVPLIPLPYVEEPLVDIFEEEDKIKVLMQCRCMDHKIAIRKLKDNIQICLENECWKIKLPAEKLRIKNISMKCNNNNALEIVIPKAY